MASLPARYWVESRHSANGSTHLFMSTSPNKRKPRGGGLGVATASATRCLRFAVDEPKRHLVDSGQRQGGQTSLQFPKPSRRYHRRIRISLRSVMQALSFAILAVPAMLTNRSALAAKMSQASAAYQNSPKGSENCGNCKLFVPPSSCTLVEGPISPQGWCKFWVGK